MTERSENSERSNALGRRVQLKPPHTSARWLVLLLCFALVSPANGESHKFAVRADRILLRDGVPFFPVGIYYAGEDLNDESGKGLTALREMGFNTIFHHGGIEERAKLDRAAAAGLHVQFRPTGSLNQGFDKLTSLVTALRDHPALLFWELEDEPVLNRVNLEQTRLGYELVKRLDPDHPVLSVQWPDWKRGDELARWSTVCDVYGFDMYPVPLKRWFYQGANIPQAFPYSIAIMGHVTQWCRTLAPRKPVIPVLQAWAWRPNEDGESGYPTRAQGRFMAYQVVIRGASGILYYGQPHVTAPNTAAGIPEMIAGDPAEAARQFQRAQSLNTKFWVYHTDVVREVAEMSPVFCATDAVSVPTVRVVGKSSVRREEIETRVKLGKGGSPVILMVNASDQAVSIRVTMPAFSSAVVHRWHEERQLAADDTGGFEDRLEPFDVRIYSSATQARWLERERAAQAVARPR